MNNRELMQQALDALNLETPVGAYFELKNALRYRIRQTEQEPLDEMTVFFLADKYLYEGGKNYGILEFARAIESRHGIES